MIVFDLECRTGGHRFEGWFGSSDEFARQQAGGLVDCPQCGSADVAKAPMAPRLARKGNQQAAVAVAPRGSGAPGAAAAMPGASSPEPPVAPAIAAPPLPPQAVAALQALAAMQAEALRHSRWVGERFADDVRAMHYGELDAEPVHGQANADEARELLDEGIMIMPLPFPVAPPDELN